MQMPSWESMLSGNHSELGEINVICLNILIVVEKNRKYIVLNQLISPSKNFNSSWPVSTSGLGDLLWDL